MGSAEEKGHPIIRQIENGCGTGKNKIRPSQRVGPTLWCRRNSEREVSPGSHPGKTWASWLQSGCERPSHRGLESILSLQTNSQEPCLVLIVFGGLSTTMYLLQQPLTRPSNTPAEGFPKRRSLQLRWPLDLRRELALRLQEVTVITHLFSCLLRRPPGWCNPQIQARFTSTRRVEKMKLDMFLRQNLSQLTPRFGTNSLSIRDQRRLLQTTSCHLL